MNFAKVLFLFLILASCQGSKKTSKSPNSASSTTSVQLPAYEFYRGACFGTCPVYRISVYPDRHAIYEAIRFTKQQGLLTAQLSEEDYDALQASFTNPDFNTYEDFYDSQIADLPMYVISQFSENNKETSKYNLDAPEGLKKISSIFERLDTTVNWQPALDINFENFGSTMHIETGEEFDVSSIADNAFFAKVRTLPLGGKNEFAFNYNSNLLSHGQVYHFLKNTPGVKKVRIPNMDR